ncbi:hypothetical protein ACHAWF_005456 [Thalassiosira exigua]
MATACTEPLEFYVKGWGWMWRALLIPTRQKFIEKNREICADVLLGSNRADYKPFAECGEGHINAANDGVGGGNHPSTFEEYVDNVRSTSTWGGQREIRVLSEGLKCAIIYCAPEGTDDDDGHENWKKKKALLLSFHRHHYALGEHYNSVIPK